MPLCTIHLLSLHTTTPNPLPTFLSTLKSTNISPLVVSRVVRWIILPTTLSTDALLARNIHWDILLILPSTTTTLPPQLQEQVHHQWSVTAGVPSRLLSNFPQKNKSLLHPDPATVPQLSQATLAAPRLADSAQDLELSPELQAWIREFSTAGGAEGRGAVSMLNLLSFKPGLKASYLEYGKAFGESIGSKRGGDAKIVGTVVEVNGQRKEKGEGGEGAQGEGLWDEVALAHYPSILHFAEMLGSGDYQEVNKRYRVPALRDTFILCTSEIGIEGIAEGGRGGAKL